MDIICKAVRTGEVGDGKNFFYLPIKKVVRIRTGERGGDAVLSFKNLRSFSSSKNSGRKPEFLKGFGFFI